MGESPIPSPRGHCFADEYFAVPPLHDGESVTDWVGCPSCRLLSYSAPFPPLSGVVWLKQWFDVVVGRCSYDKRTETHQILPYDRYRKLLFTTFSRIPDNATYLIF